MTYDEAVTEVALALRSGRLEAQGAAGFRDDWEPIRREDWARAEWGRVYDPVRGEWVWENDRVRVGPKTWTQVRVPREQILLTWPAHPAPTKKKRGPKVDGPFPHGELIARLKDGVVRGTFTPKHGPTRIARMLHAAGHLTDWESLKDFVRGHMEEVRESAFNRTETRDNSAE